MKNIFVMALLCAIAINLKAQNTFPYPSSGNIGIGTTSPQATLDVNGSIAMSGIIIHSTQNMPIPSDGTYVLASGSRIKGTYTLNFEGPDRVQMVVLLVNGCQYDLNSSIAVLSNNSYTGATVMSNFRFLFGSDRSTIYLVFDVANRNGGTGDITGHFEGNGVYVPNWGGTLPGSPEATGFYPFAVNMGKVGIGMTNPSTGLLVAQGLITSQTAATLNAGNNDAFNLYAGGGGYLNGARHSILWSQSGYILGRFGTEYNLSRGQVDFVWRDMFNGGASTTESMRLTAGGDLGIGTTTPDAKLAVNGNIHAKAVKVDLVGWPDHVFKPTYNLKPLSEVKTYINQNHHLPDMPSEKEVVDKGLDLGEMNKLLVKKVEELTLYMIKQQEEIELLKSKMNVLNKK